jgi:hypothetical protein
LTRWKRPRRAGGRSPPPNFPEPRNSFRDSREFRGSVRLLLLLLLLLLLGHLLPPSDCRCRAPCLHQMDPGMAPGCCGQCGELDAQSRTTDLMRTRSCGPELATPFPANATAEPRRGRVCADPMTENCKTRTAPSTTEFAPPSRNPSSLTAAVKTPRQTPLPSSSLAP